MIFQQYSFSTNPYSLVDYKNCIFHGELKEFYKQNTAILLLDNQEVLVANFLHDQLNGNSIVFLNPNTYVIGSYTRGMLDGQFILRNPTISVYWNVRMNKIQGQIILINYQEKYARIWVIINGQGSCLKHISITEKQNQNDILSSLSPDTPFYSSSIQFLKQKFSQSLTIESSGLNQTCQVSLKTNSLSKIKLSIFRDKLVEYGLYYKNQLNGLGYCIEGAFVLEGNFKNGKLDGYGIKYEIQSQKIIYGTFERGNIRSIETVTDDQFKARNQLKNYKKQQHMYSLEYCNNYFNQRPVLILSNFFDTIQSHNKSFTLQLQYQETIFQRTLQKSKQQSYYQKGSQEKFSTLGRMNFGINAREKKGQNLEKNQIGKRIQPFQSRFKKNQQIEPKDPFKEPIEFKEGINQYNKINKVLGRFK